MRELCRYLVDLIIRCLFGIFFCLSRVLKSTKTEIYEGGDRTSNISIVL